MTTDGRLEYRLTPIRVVDSVLSTLQTTFANPNLFGDGQNPLLFVRGDPKHSSVWVCDPESRISVERDGSRMLIMVSRGDYVPQNMHLGQYAGGEMTGDKYFSDSADCPVFVDCEAGSKLSSDRLAAICYFVLKQFRLAIMAEYDLQDLRVLSVSPPVNQGDAPGSNWICRVSVNIAIQEHALVSDVANVMNTLDVTADVDDADGARVISLPTASDPAFPDRP